jgi:prepilin-type N-terminal cleavage/methylation domain-containing protein
MSTKPIQPARQTAVRRRDAGMTLPELLISITLTGLLASVLAAALTVTLKQASSTEGRANVARAESSIDTWLPADLASTDVNDTTLPAVSVDPAATPCGTCIGIDMSGTNALQLAWESRDASGAIVVTKVQYQYIEVAGEWQLRRIECVGAAQCTSTVVLHDLAAPSGGFVPKSAAPSWVMSVAVPSQEVLDPTNLDLSLNARQIVVSINGGGAVEGAGGGLNTVKLTAGGRTTAEIDATKFNAPQFVRANSRCGGPITLIIDDSGSIGSANVTNVVKPGVAAFIEAFRGTPTQIQVVRFSSEATAIGAGPTWSNTKWHNYVDMTNDAAVDTLKSQVSASLVASGGTNWEEAFYRTFKNSDGTQAAVIPNRIVFFTDGVPTVNRSTRQYNFATNTWSSPSGTVGTGSWGSVWSEGSVPINYNNGEYGSAWTQSENGSDFNQESWDRADVILDQHRGVDKIFVGVGADLEKPSSWIHNPAVYGDRFAAPKPAISLTGSQILARLLTDGQGNPVAATQSGTGSYTNPETADFYLQTNFSATNFANAMKAAALKDCGGTLTVQTRLDNGTPAGVPVDDEFIYENRQYRTAAGVPVTAAGGGALPARSVTTSATFRTGTFDFDIASSSPYYSVDIVPQGLNTLGGYTPVSWTCKSGGVLKTPEGTIMIPDSAFTGFTMKVYPNEAISCILKVTVTP